MEPAVTLHYFFQDNFGTPTRITVQLSAKMIFLVAGVAVATSMLMDT